MSDTEIEKANRTDAQINTAEVETVTMAGKQYVVGPCRGRLRIIKTLETLEAIVPDIQPVLRVVVRFFMDKATENTEEEYMSIIGNVLPMLGSKRLQMFDALYDYSVDMQADRERLDGDGGATDEEFCEAFFVMIRQLYGPFVAQIVKMVMEIKVTVAELEKSLPK